MSDFPALLREWQVYFQMTAECSATLLGLMFLVVTQGVGAIEGQAMRVVHTFLNPIMGYYIQALLISALLCVPHQTAFSLGLQVLLVAIVRTILLAQNFTKFRYYHRRRKLEPGKWFHHGFLPGLTVPLYLFAINSVAANPVLGLEALAIVVLYGIVNGIVEAWRLILLLAELNPEELNQLYAHQA